MKKTFFTEDVVQSDRLLYTPSPFAKSNLIHLQEIGSLTALEPHTSRRANLASYLFFIVKKGAGTFQYDNIDYALAKDDCVFIDCQKPYAHRSSDDLWQLEWAHFYGPNMNGLYTKYLQHGGTACFHSQYAGKYSAIIEELQLIAGSDSRVRDMQIYERLIRLTTLIMDDCWSETNITSKNGLFKNKLQPIKEYLDENYAEHITLDGLAEQFYVNKYYLARIFKRQYGMSIGNYLIQIRITQAKRLLRFSDYSVEEIGQMCGISDASYFGRMFHKVENISPGGFRKMWRD